METLPLIVWYLDDPVADPALVPLYFIAREARKHVKVVLSGEGADELFGGYTIYREPISLRAFDHVPRVAAARARQAVDQRSPRARAARTCCAAASIGIEERYYGNARIFRPDEMRTLPQLRPGGVLHGRHPRRSTRQTDAPRRLDPDAVRRPVHLAARRHPRQGRQDDDGQLARAAGAVPRHRGVRRRLVRSRPT